MDADHAVLTYREYLGPRFVAFRPNLANGSTNDASAPIDGRYRRRKGVIEQAAREGWLLPLIQTVVSLARRSVRGEIDLMQISLPMVREIRTAAITTLRDIAAALNAREVRTARGGGCHSSFGAQCGAAGEAVGSLPTR